VKTHRKQRNVSRIDAEEGRRKMRNHIPSGGMCWSKMTEVGWIGNLEKQNSPHSQ